MTAREAISRFLRDIADIDRRTAALKQARAEKVRAIRNLEVKEAMASGPVERAPAMACR